MTRTKTRGMMSMFHASPGVYDNRYQWILWDYCLEHIARYKDEFDVLYIIDSNSNFTDVEKNHIREKSGCSDAKIIKPDFKHWEQSQKLWDLCTEDHLALFDHDMIFLRKGIIDAGFSALDNEYDVVSIFEAGAYTTQGIWPRIIEKFPVMNDKTKFALYFWVTKVAQMKQMGEFSFRSHHYNVGEYIKELDYTTQEGDWVEALGQLTITMLGKGLKVLELENDLFRLPYLHLKAFEGKRGKDLGYHHIRGGQRAAYLLTTRNIIPERTAYDKWIKHKPKQQVVSDLAWFWNMDTASKFHNDVIEVVHELGISDDLWMLYVERMKEYYHMEDRNDL